jgi:hypothetical protein
VILRSRHSVAALWAIWLGLIIVVNLLNLPKAWPNSVAPVIVLSLGMVAFGVAFVAFGRLLARDEGLALLDFIRQTAGADDLPSNLPLSR